MRGYLGIMHLFQLGLFRLFVFACFGCLAVELLGCELRWRGLACVACESHVPADLEVE